MTDRDLHKRIGKQTGLTDHQTPPLRVLVVDDDGLVRGVLAHILKASGHIVVGTVGDGRQAVAFYRQLRPDLVLMDMEMPNLDGITATQQILAEDPAATVIVCSGAEPIHSRRRAHDAGAAAFLPKPFEISHLLSLLDLSAERST